MSWSSPSKRPCIGTDAIIGQTRAILLAISYHIPSYSDVFPKTVYNVYIKYHTPHFSLSVTCFWLHPTFLLLVPEILIFIFFILTDVHHRFLLQLRSSSKKRGLHDEWYGNKHAPTSAKILNQWCALSMLFLLCVDKVILGKCWITSDHVGSCCSLEMSHNQSSNAPSLLLDGTADVQQVHLGECHGGGWNPVSLADEMETCEDY